MRSIDRWGIRQDKPNLSTTPTNTNTNTNTTKRLYDLVRPCDDKYRPAFYMALRNTLVAPSLDAAVKIAYEGGFGDGWSWIYVGHVQSITLVGWIKMDRSIHNTVSHPSTPTPPHTPSSNTRRQVQAPRGDPGRAAHRRLGRHERRRAQRQARGHGHGGAAQWGRWGGGEGEGG